MSGRVHTFSRYTPLSMPLSVSLTIPQPCHENWNQMLPMEASSRHCTACQETVTDFTAMTDAEIVAFLSRRPDVSCGRFSETQLDRQLHGLPIPASRWHVWLAATSALMSIRIFSPVSAQAQKVSTEIADIPRPNQQSFSCETDELARLEMTAEVSAANPSTASTDSVTLRGTVHNWWGLPLAHARVRMSGITVYTNAVGHFKLVVPGPLPEGNRMSVISSGYGSKRVALIRASHRYHILVPKAKRVLSGKFR